MSEPRDEMILEEECPIEEDNYEDNDYEYNDDDYYPSDHLELQKSLSDDRPYSIYTLEQLLKKIREEIEQKSILCAMPDGWTLMLYYFTNFNSNYFDDLLDHDQTGRNIIKYKQNYEVATKEGECAVCACQVLLFYNPCGHGFCRQCWKHHVSFNNTDRNIYELFPLCQKEGCYERTNYHLMETLWQDEPSLRENFERLLCLKYSQKSIRVKICPNQTCGKAIYMNSVAESTVLCECGTEVCRHCGLEGHWPVQCVDLQNWNSMVNDKQNQWINKLVTQKCPMCKETIEKNDGCIHMTCVCKYEFCWICLKVWKGHTNYYACSSVAKDDHEKKLQEEQEKRSKDENFYNERFEEAKGEVERLGLSIKRIINTNPSDLIKRLEEVHVLSIYSNVLVELKEFIKKSWHLVHRCSIYNFFEREEFKFLRRLIFRLNRGTNAIDDFVSDSIRKRFKAMDDGIAQIVKTHPNNEAGIEAEKEAAKKWFLEEKERLSIKMREGLRVIEHIRKGEISFALAEVVGKNSSLYVEQEPTDLLAPVPKSQPIQSES